MIWTLSQRLNKGKEPQQECELKKTAKGGILTLGYTLKGGKGKTNSSLKAKGGFS